MNKEIYDQIRKSYPDEFALIQLWFNTQTKIQSTTWFYQQPIFKQELLVLYLFDKYKFKIDTDCRFVENKNNFLFIYQVVDTEGDEHIISDRTFATRYFAELDAVIKCFKKIHDRRLSSN